MPQIEISAGAFEFLKKHAKPLEDTTVTVVDRLIAELNSLKAGSDQINIVSGMILKAQDAPSMKFTTVLEAVVNGVPASQNYWNNILEDVIRACAKGGGSTESILKSLSANVKEGATDQNGFRYIKEAGISFQGLEANRAYRNIVALATKFHIQLSISVKWPNRDDVPMPNGTAKIIYP